MSALAPKADLRIRIGLPATVSFPEIGVDQLNLARSDSIAARFKVYSSDARLGEFRRDMRSCARRILIRHGENMPRPNNPDEERERWEKACIDEPVRENKSLPRQFRFSQAQSPVSLLPLIRQLHRGLHLWLCRSCCDRTSKRERSRNFESDQGLGWCDQTYAQGFYIAVRQRSCFSLKSRDVSTGVLKLASFGRRIESN